jgi:hypothetical protein
VNDAESSQEDDAFRPAGCWTGAMLMLAVVALLPTCMLGILVLTSRLEGWLARGEPRGARGEPRDR